MESPAKISHDPLQSQPILNHHLNERSSIVVIIIILFCVAIILSPFPFTGQIASALFFSALLLHPKLRLRRWEPQVYMVDFLCYTPPATCRVPRATFMEHVSTMGIFDADSVALMERVTASSGQGERTCLPPALFYIPPRPHHKETIQEAHMLLFPAIDALLCKARLSPRSVDILIVNCSGACTAPSLSSMVVNRFGMRDDVKAFTLSGMGCSASMIAVHMAANLLKVHKNSNAVIVSTEMLTSGWYTGKEHSKLGLNCVFRTGSAAILLSNTNQPNFTSKYKLILTQRRQLASDDTAYRSAFRDEDQQGITGVTLTRHILHVAARAVKTSVVDLATSLLPWSEKTKYVMSCLFKAGGKEGPYVPNLKAVISHFCLPTSGRRFIREMAKGLTLDEEDTEAAMATLHRFGNQSSSGLWYELAYLEAKGVVKEGDKVWQLGMGSGVKTATVVWECIRPISNHPNIGPWADSIHDYPNLAHSN